MNKIDKIKQGKRNRNAGRLFELKVREDLEETGYFVSKSEINIDLETKKVVPAKCSRFRLKSTGFPDFIAFKRMNDFESCSYTVIGVECKGGKQNKYLSKEEKEKCRLMLDLRVFDHIFLATRQKEGRKIIPKYTNILDIINKK